MVGFCARDASGAGEQMKSQLKISGKKFPAVKLDREILANWSFEKRPGGWIIATVTKIDATQNVATQNVVIKRFRFFYERTKKNFWIKVTTPSNAHYFFGEKIDSARAGSSAASASDLTAQFPGKVRKILVAEGQGVEANAPLMMVEAMKMEFAIKAHVKGTVKKILVTEGQQLTPGQQLIDFEEEKS